MAESIKEEAVSSTADDQQLQEPYEPHETCKPLSFVSSENQKAIISVMAVVVDHGIPTPTKKQCMQTLRLRDPTTDKEVIARIFRSSMEGDNFPIQHDTGRRSVIALHGMRVFRVYATGEWILLATERYSYALISFKYGINGGTHLSRGPDKSGYLTHSMMLVAKMLDAWWEGGAVTTVVRRTVDSTTEQDGTGTTTVQTSTQRRAGPEDASIKDLKPPTDGKKARYYNIVGKVVKVYEPGQLDWMTVYITDYTKNPLLYNYTYDEKTDDGNLWGGPLGQHTLQVTLWDNNATFARSAGIDEGKYVLLRNMAVKKTSVGYLEGSVHGDRNYPDKKLVYILDNHFRIGEIMRNQSLYSLDYEKNKTAYTGPRAPSVAKVTRPVATETEDGHEKDLPTDQEAQRRPPDETPIRSDGNTADQDAVSDDRPRPLSNPNIRMENSSSPETPIADIVKDLEDGQPFRNVKYHIFCRVIDFLPTNLRDFTVQVLPGEVEPDPEAEVDMEIENQPQWIWRFALLVEGLDGATMRLIVSGDEAEYLLKMKAPDLRADEIAFVHLKERLFKLWGNLEEVKAEQADTLRRSTEEDRGEDPGDVGDARPQENGPSDDNQPTKKRRRRGRPKKNKKQKANDSGATNAGGDADEEEGEESEVASKFFHACIVEYGVDEGAQCKRLWKLAKTTIM